MSRKVSGDRYQGQNMEWTGNGCGIPDPSPWRGIVSIKEAMFSNIRFRIESEDQILFWLETNHQFPSLRCARDHRPKASSYIDRVRSLVTLWSCFQKKKNYRKKRREGQLLDFFFFGFFRVTFFFC